MANARTCVVVSPPLSLSRFCLSEKSLFAGSAHYAVILSRIARAYIYTGRRLLAREGLSLFRFSLSLSHSLAVLGKSVPRKRIFKSDPRDEMRLYFPCRVPRVQHDCNGNRAGIGRIGVIGEKC